MLKNKILAIAALALSLFAAPAFAQQMIQYDAAGVKQYVDAAGHPLPVFEMRPGTPLNASSGNVANASAVATLAGAALQTTYITGFQCTAAGATAAAVVSVTVTGLLGGTQTYTFTFPAGVTTQASHLQPAFDMGLPASAANTAIVVTLPAGGAGNTNASCNAQGYRF